MNPAWPSETSCSATCVKPALSYCSQLLPPAARRRSEHEQVQILLAYELCDRLEVTRQGELGGEVAAHGAVRGPLLRDLAGFGLARGEGACHLAVDRAGAPASLNSLTICSSGFVLIVPSPLAAASFAAFGALAATRIGGGDVGCVVQLQLLDGVVLAAEGLVLAGEELAHQVDRLLEHLEPLVGAGPAVAQDVLVQVLAGADAEEEAPSSMFWAVAAACATIAGCMRISGQVTAVPTPSFVASPSAPITLQTNGLCPWASTHGWMWSEIRT